MDEQQPTAGTKPRKARRSRRRDFGCVIAVGTATEPSFVIRWWDHGKRRQQSGFKTRKEAQEALAKARLELADGTAAAKQKAETTLETVATKWLALHSAQLRSHDDNEERWEKHVKPRLGHLPLAAITAERLLEFRSGLLALAGDDKLAPATINRVLALLRSILKFAAAHGYINASPTDRMSRGTYMLPLEKKKIPPPIERPADVGRFLDAMRGLYPRLFALFATAVYTGLRKGELAGLSWEDVDLERGFILVRRSYENTTKSAKWRSVPIPPPLKPILAEHRMRDPFKTALVFTNDAGEMITKDTRLQDMVADGCKAVGLKEIGLHALRHEYASMYLAMGGNISDLQKNLGHSSVSVTEIYVHSADEHRIAEAQRLKFEAPPDAKVVVLDGRNGGGK